VLDADRRGLRGTRMTSRQTRWALLDAAILPVVFLGSIPVAYLVSPDWAQRCWIILAVIYPVVGRLEQRSGPRKTGDATTQMGNTPA
jgi:hypothetical protein